MDISVTTSSSSFAPTPSPKGYRETTTGWDCDRCGAQVARDRTAEHDEFHERVEPRVRK